MAINQYSASENDVVSRGTSHVDTRSTWRLFSEETPRPEIANSLGFALMMGCMIFPALSILAIPTMIIHIIWTCRNRRNKMMPLKMPIEFKDKTDFNQYVIGQRGKKFGKSQGTIFLGREENENKELWLTPKDLLTHSMVLGASGSGKTELLISVFGVNALCMGTGLTYIDAKAGVDLLQTFMTLARIFGRDDCVRVISYLLGGTMMEPRTWIKKSNTANPFSIGTADNAVTLLQSMLPESQGDNAYFADRARAIVGVSMPALVEMRDKGFLSITPSIIGQFMSVPRFIEMAFHEYDGIDIHINGVPYPSIKLSKKVTDPIRTFLKQLPGFKADENGKPEPADKQSEDVYKQFSFAEGYYAKLMTSLAGKFAHIYEHELAEADPVDCLFQSRICLVMIPSLEIDPDEAKSLGQIVLSGIKIALSLGLGQYTEGTVEQVLDSRPVDVKLPNMLVIDEYPGISIPGFSTIATQGRSVGTSACFSGQELAGFMRASEEETDQIFGSTRLKIVGTLMETDKTWPRFKALAAQHMVSMVKSSSRKGSPTYTRSSESHAEMVDRIDFKDMTAQTEGEVHMFYHDKVIRGNVFNHGLNEKEDLVKHYSIPRLLKIKAPDPIEIDSLVKFFDRTDAYRNRFNQNKPLIKYKSNRFWNSVIATIDDTVSWPYRAMLPIATNHTKAEAEDRPLKNSESAGAVEKRVEIHNEVDEPSGYEPDFEETTGDEIEGSANSWSEQVEKVYNKDIVDNESIDEVITEPPPTEASDTPTEASDAPTEASDAPAKPADTVNEYYNIFSKLENSWVFNSVYNENGLAKLDEYVDGLASINEMLGLSEDDARLASVKAVEMIPEITGGFPTSNVVFDAKSIEDAINSLIDVTE